MSVLSNSSSRSPGSTCFSDVCPYNRSTIFSPSTNTFTSRILMSFGSLRTTRIAPLLIKPAHHCKRFRPALELFHEQFCPRKGSHQLPLGHQPCAFGSAFGLLSVAHLFKPA